MDRLSQLRKLIDRSDIAYYNSGQSFLSDEQYDALKDELIKLAPGDERNTRFGPPVLDKMLQKVKHGCPMYSLGKHDTPDELRRWYADMLSALPDGTHNRRGKVHVSLKADGGSVALYYIDGVLARAVTRGNDQGIGEDITANAINFIGVPTQLPLPVDIAVRGEVVLCKSAWEKIDVERASNPRNLGNGMMRRLDGVGSPALSFLAFDMTSMKPTLPDEILTETDKLTFLDDQGFTVVEAALFDTIDEAISWYDMTAKHRERLDIWIDGVVFKMNDLALQAQLGVVDNRPRAQTVLKFEAEGAETKLLDVVFSIGHTGAIIPTGKVSPVRIGGTTISSVLLNNFQLISDLDVAVGDTVWIIKAKDIIPQVKAVLKRPADRVAIVAPSICPVCGGKTGRRIVGKKASAGAVTECKNDSCPARSDARLKTWITKLDIQGIGDEVLGGLIGNMGVKTPVDLYRLATDTDMVEALAEMKVGAGKLGAKRCLAIVDQILSKRAMPLHVFMGSLGIPHLGRRRAELIMAAVPGCFDTIDKWVEGDNLARYADAANIPNIHKEISAGIQAFYDEIQGLRAYVTIQDVPKEALPKAGPLCGRTYCFTGKIEKVDKSGKRYTRDRMQQLVLDNGGSVSDDIKSGVTHLVQADPSSVSTKTTKAKKLGVSVVSEEDFFASIGE